MKLGEININTAYLGDTSISSMYLGDTRVFGGQSVDNALRFTSTSSASVKLTANGTSAPRLWYSTDGRQTWTLWDYSKITFTGDLFIKGLNPDGISTSHSNYSTFVMTGQVKVSGNIMHLIDYTQNLTTVPCDYCFYKLFYYCSSLTQAPKLPATTLTSYCYDSMFEDCSSLVTAPSLPATTLSSYCYRYMFQNCTHLTTVSLPATTLAEYCYRGMFSGCTALVNAPALPATTLTASCYYSMFVGCSALVQAPLLPATTLAEYCYAYMFQNCTHLTTVSLPATTLASYCYHYMFYGCSAMTESPELPAETLVYSCYDYMFYNCSNLNTVSAYFTTTPGTNYTDHWLSGVSATGTFNANGSETWSSSITRGESTVPEGWSIPKYNFNTRVVKNNSWSTDYTSNFDITVTGLGNKKFKVEFTYNGAQGEGWHPSEASCQIYNITDNPWYSGTPTYSNSWGGNIWQSSGRSMQSESGAEYDHTVNHYFNDYGISWNTGYTLTVTIQTV